MKPDVIGLIRDVRKPKNTIFRNKVYIFLACFLLAIFIWLLVRLSKDYYHTIHFGLRYTHVPEYLLLTGHSENKLAVKIRVQGYDVFSEEYLKSNDKILEISMKSLKLKASKDNHVTGYLLASSVANDIVSQFNYPFEIYSISPDTLFFSFERRTNHIKRIRP